MLWLLLACSPNPDDGSDPSDTDATEESCGTKVAAWTDADGDGYGDAALPTEVCTIEAGLADNGDDCDDADPDVHPSADERCNGVDDDCDGGVDDDAIDMLIGYLDTDGDGYGEDSDTVEACELPTGYAEQDGDCAPSDSRTYPGALETCDGTDEDCSGVIDDAGAIGSDPDCPATDCVELRDLGATSGLSWLDGDGDGVAWEVYCEQELAGGGWAMAWKNVGGALDPTYSTYELFNNQATVSNSPHWVEGDSGFNERVMGSYATVPGMQLMRVDTLWDVDATEIDESVVVLELQGNSLEDLFMLEEMQLNQEVCVTLPDQVQAWAGPDGDIDLGATNQMIQYIFSSGGYRLVLGFAANYVDGTGTSHSCSQPASNLLDDASGYLARPDGVDTNAGLYNLLGYDFFASNGDATRCMHQCWDGSWNGGMSDGFTWFFRPGD